MAITINELSELCYIKKEIAQIQRELAELERKRFHKKEDLLEVDKNSNKELEKALNINLFTLQRKRVEAEEFLGNIEDAEMRLIFRLRIINNMSFEKIGEEIGMDRRTVSRKFYQYLKFAHNAHLSCPIMKES